MLNLLDGIRGIVGIGVIILIVWIISEDRKRIPYRLIISGLSLQFVIALSFFKLKPVASVFHGFAAALNKLFSHADSGIFFVFGNELGSPDGPAGFIFAIRVLPLIIFFSSLVAVLYHFGIMQKMILGIAWVLKKTMRVGGIEAVVVAANVFVGQTEAPLCIRPYLKNLTRSQIATMMISGFATVAGTVIVSYVVFLGGEDPEARVFFLQHLLTASVISAPAAFVIAKILVPEVEEPNSVDKLELSIPVRKSWNVFDAAAQGASDGLKLAVNIGAMLIAYISLVSLINWPISIVSQEIIGHEITIQEILGVVLSPIVWFIGVSWNEALQVGTLIGEKLILTEFVAYQSLGTLVSAQPPVLSDRSIIIATYALCGFSNVASIAVQIGALTILAPKKRKTVVELGLKAVICGQLATLMTAAIAGILIV